MTEELIEQGCKGVFFTLTYNDDSVPMNLFEDGTVSKSVEGYHYKDISPYSTSKVVHVWNDLDKDGKKAFYEAHDNNPPEDAIVVYSVRKKDVQDWLKRCRYFIGDGKNLSYFITAEYGPNTLRPHYHGCFFGVSKSDCIEAFNDWRNKFGFVMCDDIDLTKGGIGYCAKYCSKGVYEHPFCSKDFFYWKKNGGTLDPIVTTVHDDEGKDRPHLNEYHSKHYERCLQYFGIDEPICDPVFRLMSKSLGSGFLKNEEQQRYHLFGTTHEVRFEERPFAIDLDGNVLPQEEIYDVVAPTWSQRIGFNMTTSKSVHTDKYDHTRYVKRTFDNIGKTRYGTFSYGADPFETTHEAHECDFSRVGRKFLPVLCKKSSLSTDFSKVGDIYVQKDLLEDLHTIITRNKYYKKNYGSGSKTQGKAQVYGYAMPRYYYEKMFGEDLRMALSAVVLQDDVELYQEQFRTLRANDPTREDTEILLGMEYEKEREKAERIYRCFKAAERQYGKSKL